MLILLTVLACTSSKDSVPPTDTPTATDSATTDSLPTESTPTDTTPTDTAPPGWDVDDDGDGYTGREGDATTRTPG